MKIFRYKSLLNSLAIVQLLSWDVEAYSPNNHTIIKIINSINTTWRAGENPTDIPRRFPKFKGDHNPHLATIQRDHLPTPETFDARTHWKHCSSVISRIRHQHNCGSCWAVAAAAMLSDRICIETNGTQKIHLSVEDVITCCDFCKKGHKHSCRAARVYDAVTFWIKEGIVSGGELGSVEGCKPYSFESSIKQHQECTRNCTNRSYKRKYSQDKYFGKLIYNLPKNEDAIRSEIFTHGPVVAAVSVYEDFRHYRAGVYRHAIGRFEGMHSLKIIGWGEERSTKYWLASNGWGPGYGWQGYIKFLRGENHLKIEQHVIAGRMFGNLSPRETLIGGVGGPSRGSSLRPPVVSSAMIVFQLCLYLYSKN